MGGVGQRVSCLCSSGWPQPRDPPNSLSRTRTENGPNRELLDHGLCWIYAVGKTAPPQIKGLFEGIACAGVLLMGSPYLQIQWCTMLAWHSAAAIPTLCSAFLKSLLIWLLGVCSLYVLIFLLDQQQQKDGPFPGPFPGIMMLFILSFALYSFACNL